MTNLGTARVTIQLPPGFRWIEKADISRPFRTREDSMDRYSLADYYEWSKDSDSLVIVREHEGNIAAVVWATVHEDHLMIEMLGRNRLLGYKGAGGELTRLLETVVALALGLHEIRLESIAGAVRHHDDVLGYVEYGSKKLDPDMGELTPKRKRV